MSTGAHVPGPGVPRVLVVIPTYEEALALPDTLARLRAAVPGADVLVVDDGSPDGTGELAERAGDADPAVHVLHRTSKQGLGTAYVDGFRWGLERGYDVIVEMDADGSHQPEELPTLLAAMSGDGVDGTPAMVIGSRWVADGRVENWPGHRRLLSRGGNAYTRVLMGLPVHDATAGFRAYRADVLAALPLGDVASQGYCFQVDMAWRVHRTGGVIREVPICFVERTLGDSKMSREIVLEALVRVTLWGLRARAEQARGVLVRIARVGRQEG